MSSDHPEIPTQTIPDDTFGIRYDYNQGIRLYIPENPLYGFQYRITCPKQSTVIVSGDTANISTNYNTSTNSPAYLIKTRQTWRIDAEINIWIYQKDNPQNIKHYFKHVYNAKDKDVLMSVPEGTLGDQIAWHTYITRYGQETGARLIITASKAIQELFADAHPNHQYIEKSKLTDNIKKSLYACYHIGLFYKDKTNDHQPLDFRYVGLHKTAGHILNVPTDEEPPKICIDEGGPPISQPYVCIAVQASMFCKRWNNPLGWIEVVSFIKEQGYEVVCIDRETAHGQSPYITYAPPGCRIETGNRSLRERARWLTHATAFIGVSSGLAWLAWACKTPVVMISGFTAPFNEFQTEGRVFNPIGCNSCWHDPTVEFTAGNFTWCPRHEKTPREYECSKIIAADTVIDALLKVAPQIETKITEEQNND